MQTLVINSAQQFNDCFNTFKETARVVGPQHVFIVGLDTEFICSSNYPIAYSNSTNWIESQSNTNIAICTIQLATDTMCLVINLVKMGLPMPKNLKDLLTKDSWIKVGVGVDLDLKYLSENYNLGHCGGTIEIKNIARLALYKNPSLDYLFNHFVGGNVKKSASGLCDWTQELTLSQIEYAAKDAIMSIKIFQEIMKPSIDNMIQKKPETDILEINIVNMQLTQNITTENINYIGKLNEYAQKNQLSQPIYQEETTEKNIFVLICKFNDKFTKAEEASKKKAKTKAAEKMCKLLNL